MDAASVSVGAPGNRRVLVISPGPVGRRMPGPSIRGSEIARTLAPHADVTLAAVEGRDEVDPKVPHVSLLRDRPGSWGRALQDADVVITPPPSPDLAHWCRRSGARLIYDLYDPEPLEVAAHPALRPRDGGGPSLRHRAWSALTLDRTLEGLRDAHHFVCASERQRDFWMGALMGQGRLDSEAHHRDPTLRDLIDVVPFGLPSAPPAATGGGAGERFDAIGPQDEVVLWNGGLWNWLDALTPIRAAGLLAERRPGLRLVFMGASGDLNAQAATAEARAEAEKLGLLGEVVLFNEEWVPYEQRAAWLLGADCAVSAHHDRLETRMAFRTRLLDCFWAGLPVVCSSGDELAEQVESAGAGAAVATGDSEGMAAALEQVLERGRPAYADALAGLADRYSWDRVVEPLVKWIERDGADRPPRTSRPAARALRVEGYRWGRLGLDALGIRVAPRAGTDGDER